MVGRKEMSKSALEETFAMQVKAVKLPDPVREHRFCERRWKIDFAWPEIKLGIEIEGGIWTNGRHTRGSGFLGDMQKYNRLAVLGWTVLRFDGGAVKRGEAIKEVEEVIKMRTAEE